MPLRSKELIGLLFAGLWLVMGANLPVSGFPAFTAQVSTSSASSGTWDFLFGNSSAVPSSSSVPAPDGSGTGAVAPAVDVYSSTGSDASSSSVPTFDASSSAPAAICGDGILEGGEQCENGHPCRDGFYCTAPNCQCKAYPTCGNGILDPGEQCDTGHWCVQGQYCSAQCSCVPLPGFSSPPQTGTSQAGIPAASFSAAYVTSSVSSGSISSASPILTMPIAQCGNGVLDPGEQCDDGNVSDGDGCSSACTIEEGWVCYGSPSLCLFLPPVTAPVHPAAQPSSSGSSFDVSSSADSSSFSALSSSSGSDLSSSEEASSSSVDIPAAADSSSLASSEQASLSSENVSFSASSPLVLSSSEGSSESSVSSASSVIAAPAPQSDLQWYVQMLPVFALMLGLPTVGVIYWLMKDK